MVGKRSKVGAMRLMMILSRYIKIHNKQKGLNMTESFTIYYAGDLFDHKHLIGNAILAKYIEKCSEGRYECIVPQNLEQPVRRGVDIRNKDLGKVMECDLGIFNFDGADLRHGDFSSARLERQHRSPSI